jgi:chromosomal replication initiation ATPase DnaA
MTPGLDPTLTFGTVVPGAANQLALAAARAVAESPSAPFNPLYLHGVTGSGKTHLLHAIGHRAREVNPRAVVQYLRWDDLVDGIRAAAAMGRVAEYLVPFETAGILLVDDLHRQGERDPGRGDILGLVERRLEQQRTTVLAGREGPAGLGPPEDPAPRLLGGGLVAVLLPPDSAMRWEILHRRCEEAGVALSDAVLEGVAALPFSSARDLLGAANRLIAFQAVSPRPLDPAQARVLITGVLDEPTPDTGVPADLPERSGVAEPRRVTAEDRDEFGSFLSDVVASVSQQVDTWRAHVADAILLWGGEGFRTARLQALLDQELPAQPDTVLERFEADIATLRGLQAAIADAAPELAGEDLLRDPDQVGAARELVDRVRTRDLSESQPLAHFRFEELVVGTSNRVAVDAARAMAAAPGAEGVPLLIVGDSGVGKTHLLHALGNALVEQGQRGVVCLGGHRFAALLEQSGAGDGLPAWRRRFRWASALLLDDVQLLAGQPAVQEQLVALIDEMLAARRPVIFTSASPVADLVGMAPQLLTRLAAGVEVELPRPDREVRLGVIRQLLVAIEAPDAAALADYLASRPADSFRAVHALVQRVLRAAEAGRTEPSHALARQVLEAPAARTATKPGPVRVGVVGPTLGGSRLKEKLVDEWPTVADRLIEDLR